MRRGHMHYEAAFEDYLKRLGRPYVAVDEAKKAVFAGARIKSFDFLVYSSGTTHWLVDVKGRKLSLTSPGRKGHLENWTTRQDITGLRQWARVFGAGFQGLLVFAYWLVEPAHGMAGLGQSYAFDGRQYLLAAVTVEDYAARMKDRSPRWQTVSVPAGSFRQMVRSLGEFL